jgi:hypothetical protein
MIGFGWYRPTTSLPSQTNEMGNFEVDSSNPFLTPSNSASSNHGWTSDSASPRQRVEQPSSTFVTCQKDDGPSGSSLDLDLASSQSSSERCPDTLPSRSSHSLAPSTSRHPSLASTTNAEEFYRSSTGYTAGLEEGQSQIASNRPSALYQSDIQSVLSTSNKSYASISVTPSQRQASMDGHVLSAPSPAANASPPRRRFGYRRAKTSPPRRPYGYRAERAFSFTRLPSPTPFSTQDARPISPSHRLYNAPRMDGVDLELRAMNQSMERRGAVHRTLWSEERREMTEVMDGMRMNLVRTSGIVRNDDVNVEEKTVQNLEEEQERSKKAKFGWLKKLYTKKKDKEPLTITRTRTVQVTSTRATSPSLRQLGDAAPTQPMLVPPPSSQDQQYFSTDTTVVAGSSPTTTDTTVSPPPGKKPANEITRKVARSRFPRKVWWRVLSPRAGDHVSRSGSDKFKRRAGYRRIASSSRSLRVAETS